MPSESRGEKMQHSVKIRLTGSRDSGDILQCWTLRLRERVLRLLFGGQQRITVLIPGGSVETLDIQEVDSHDAA